VLNTDIKTIYMDKISESSKNQYKI